MDIELQRRAKALDETDGCTLPLKAEFAPAAPPVSEESPQEEVEHLGAEANVASQVPADALGEGQRPLAEGTWGARGPIYVASAPEFAATTGKYFNKVREQPAAPAGQTDADARRLWQMTEELIAGIGQTPGQTARAG